MKSVSPLVADGMTSVIFINKAGTLYKHSAINRLIRCAVNNHNVEEEIRGKEHRELIMSSFFSSIISFDILFGVDFVKTKQILK